MEELFDHLVPEQIGGYKFENKLLLKQAFTRRSYSAENGGENNEVLEFIGDKALDIAVVRYLAKKFGNDVCLKNKWQQKMMGLEVKPEEFKSELDEGELTKLKQKMVSKKALAERIDDLGLAQFLIMGRGDAENNVAESDSVREDLFEAIIGAVTLDSDWDFKVIQDTVEIMLNPDSFLNDGTKADYVGLIYEWDAQYGAVPWFKYPSGGEQRSIIREPDVIYAHPEHHGVLNMPRPILNFTCQVKIQTDIPAFEAYGRSKNEARKAACRLAYEYLKMNHLLFSIKDEIENPNEAEAINQLEILARRGYFDIPEYDYVESHDENGNPVWSVKCRIKESKRSFTSVDSSKKQAKKSAAFKMLNYVLENYEEVE